MSTNLKVIMDQLIWDGDYKMYLSDGLYLGFV